MKLRSRAGPHTFEDFCALVGEGQKADLIDGVIYMASPDNTDANKLFMWLGGLIGLFVEEKELGEVYGSRVALRLDGRNGPEPDIVFIKSSRLHLVKRGCIAGPADLAVEIVSPESVERDYEKKRRQYEEFGVPEYWIVDEVEEKVTQLHLGARGKYRELRLQQGKLVCQEIPGFWLRPEWLWTVPRRKKTAVLAEILASST